MQRPASPQPVSDGAPAPRASAPGLRPNRPLLGVLYLCLGVFAFSLHDVGVKWVSGTYPLGEVLLIRSLTALPLMLLFVHLDAGLGRLFGRDTLWLTLRALVLLAGYLAYYLAFAALPFADAVALYMSVPLIIIALSGPLLGERVGLRRWLAVLAGLAGVVIMLRPGSGVFEPAALLILCCATLYSLGMIMARRLAASVPGTVMACESNIVFLVAAGIMCLALPWLGVEGAVHPSLAFLVRPLVVPSPADLLAMTTCGVCAAIGIAGLTMAYREAEATLVASFEYTALVWAVVWGYLVWHEVPGPATLVGAVLIIGAGLVALDPAGPRRQRPTAEPQG